MSRIKVFTIALLGWPIFSLAAEKSYIAPKTEFGAPDLQGTWSIATQTNLERAQRFGGKLSINEEEALRIEALPQAAERDAEGLR